MLLLQKGEGGKIYGRLRQESFQISMCPEPSKSPELVLKSETFLTNTPNILSMRGHQKRLETNAGLIAQLENGYVQNSPCSAAQPCLLQQV